MPMERVRSITLPAAGALNRGIAVTINASGQAAAVGAGVAATGITLEAATAANQDIAIGLLDGARIECEAGAAVVVGAVVAGNATGQLITAVATNERVGIAVSAAGAAGEIFDVVTSSAGSTV